MSVGDNGKFTRMRELPLDVQYYFLRMLPRDTQLFAAVACREWYNMIGKHVRVPLRDIIKYGEPWQLMFLLPKIRRNEYLTVRTILRVCKYDKIDMMVLLHVTKLKVTSLKNKYIGSRFRLFGAISVQSESCRTHGASACSRVCPMHDAAIYAIRNKNAKMLQLLGDLCPHIYERESCSWTHHRAGRIAYDHAMMCKIIDSQAIAILNDVITKPLMTQYKISALIDHATRHNKHVSSLYLANYKNVHGWLW